jgi:hypothetical protein
VARHSDFQHSVATAGALARGAAIRLVFVWPQPCVALRCADATDGIPFGRLRGVLRRPQRFRVAAGEDCSCYERVVLASGSAEEPEHSPPQHDGVEGMRHSGFGT